MAEVWPIKKDHLLKSLYSDANSLCSATVTLKCNSSMTLSCLDIHVSVVSFMRNKCNILHQGVVKIKSVNVYSGHGTMIGTHTHTKFPYNTLLLSASLSCICNGLLSALLYFISQCNQNSGRRNCSIIRC